MATNTPPAFAGAFLLAFASSAFAQQQGDDAAKPPPVIVQGDEIRGRPDIETIARGDVELRRGPVVVRADEIGYEHPDDLVRARGNVSVESQGNRFTGSEVQLRVQRFEGFVLDPTYFFALTGAGGRAERIDFLDRQRSVVVGATYTSCRADDPGGPDWLLEASRVKLDFETNEGIAEGAVLRFLGVPILGAPVLSFPLTDERKSGWLPPAVGLDSKSGFEFSVPYYWNIAPQRDATIAPTILTRRGVALNTEFRYLDPRLSRHRQPAPAAERPRCRPRPARAAVAARSRTAARRRSVATLHPRLRR